MVYRAVAQSIAIVALASASIIAWVWLFFGGDRLMWWHHQYVVVALGALVIVGFVQPFIRAWRQTRPARALFDALLSVIGCAAVVAIVYLLFLVALATWPHFVR